MRTATGEQAEKHGIQLRDHIVLSALHKSPNLTQIELAKALGLDKTTLMSLADRLERAELIHRRTARPGAHAPPDHCNRGGRPVEKSPTRRNRSRRQRLKVSVTNKSHSFGGCCCEIIGESNDPGIGASEAPTSP